MGMSVRLIIFNVCFFLILLMGVLLFSFSFHIVELNRVAIYQSTYSKSITTGQLYNSGRYFTGLLGKFISYDTTWQKMQFGYGNDPLLVKTSDSANLLVQVSIVYSLKPEFVVQLYNLYPQQDHAQSMRNSVKADITDQATNFAYTDFFANRAAVQDAMAQEIANTFKSSYYHELMLFSLGEVVPQSQQLEDVIESSVVSAQQITTQSIILQTLQAQAAVKSAQQQFTADVTQILSTAYTKAAATVAAATATGQAGVTLQQANAYQQFSTGLNWTQNEILKFISLYAQLQNTNTQLLLGFSNATVTFEV